MPAYTDNSTPSSSLSTSWRRLVLYITRHMVHLVACLSLARVVPQHFVFTLFTSLCILFKLDWILLDLFFSLGIYYSTSDFQCYLQWACYHLGFGSSLLFSLRFIVAFRFHCFECVPYWLYAQVNETKINQNEVHTWSTFGQICVCLCVDVFDDHSDELWDVRLGLCLLVLLIARNHFETLQWPDTQNYPIVERNPTKFKLGEEVKSYNHTRCQNKYWATF